MAQARAREANITGFVEKTFRTPDVSIHYAEGPSNGPALILLHGLARDWKSFSTLLPELSSRYHLFALDLRGHGESSRVPRGYRILDYATDVSSFLKKMLPGGAAIFGHSLGGGTAMCVAANPECHVTALIVGDSVISPENFVHSMYDPLFLQLYKLITRGLSQAELARGIGAIELQLPGFNEVLRIEELPGNTEPVLKEWARVANLTDPEALAMMLDGSSFAGWDPGRILPKISCPTLLLQGNPELDALLTDEDAKLAVSLLPLPKHIKFPLLGHALFMQQPKPVLKEIVEFLANATG